MKIIFLTLMPFRYILLYSNLSNSNLNNYSETFCLGNSAYK